MSFISKILNLITPKVVEIAGVSIVIGSSLFLPGHARIGSLVCEGIYLLNRYKPSVFEDLKSFANPLTWPGYVAMGIASLLAAHVGGTVATVFIAGIFATGVGRLFNQLY